MKHFFVRKSISASADTVWKVLIDLPKWPEWDPNCEKVTGRPALGERVTVHSKLSPGRAFPVRVAEFEPGKKMVWTGGMPLGLFVGTRTYTLESTGDAACVFSMREVFSGPFAKLITKSIPDLSVSFEAFAEGLRRTSERRA